MGAAIAALEAKTTGTVSIAYSTGDIQTLVCSCPFTRIKDQYLWRKSNSCSTRTADSLTRTATLDAREAGGSPKTISLVSVYSKRKRAYFSTVAVARQAIVVPTLGSAKKYSGNWIARSNQKPRGGIGG